MPLYEYQCSACEHHLEKLQKITEEPLLVCPRCQASSLEKCISKSGFRLKGSGWYKEPVSDKTSDSPKPEVTPSEATKPEATTKETATRAATPA